MESRKTAVLVFALMTLQIQLQLCTCNLAASAKPALKPEAKPALKPAVKAAPKAKEQEAKPAWAVEIGIGEDLIYDGKFAEGEIHLRKALSLVPTTSPVGRALVQLDLGTAVYQQGNYEEALSLFVEATKEFQKHDEEYKKELVEAYEMISRTCRHMGRAADAEAFGIKALNMCARVNGEDSVDYGLNLRNMGKLYLGLYRYLDAEDVLKKALAIFEKKPKFDQTQFAVCMDFLWWSLYEQGKNEEAAKVRARLALLEKKLGKKIYTEPEEPKEVNLEPYMRVLRYSIKKFWVQPKNSEDCRAIVFFNIHKNGKISDLKIECPSGDQDFDQCCLSAVKQAFASPIFPPKAAPESISISYTFERFVTGDSSLSGSATNKRIDPVAVALKLIAKRNYKEAKAILSMPDLASSVKSNIALATIASKLGRTEEAERYAAKAIAIDPTSVEAHKMRAQALVEELKFADAIPMYKKVIELDKDTKEKIIAGKMILLLEQDLRMGGSPLRASELLAKRKPSEALAILNHLKEKNLKNPYIEYLFSSAYKQLGQPAEALKHIKQAITLDPDDMDYRIRESWIEQSLGHGQRAVEILREIIKKSPPEPTFSYVKQLISLEEKNGSDLTSKHENKKDYFDESMMGQPRRWNLQQGQAINVYIASGDYVPGYRDELKEYLLNALKAWNEASQDRIKFKLCDDPNSADLICVFEKEKEDGSNAAEGGRTYTPGGCAYISAAIVYLKTENIGSVLSEEDYRIAALHEIGHALGLHHSKSEKDIMYFATSTRVPELSPRDKATLARLYADNLKFPEWALLDEKGLNCLKQFKPRESISALEQASKMAPASSQGKARISSHLVRAYGLAVCENLFKRTISDSIELLDKASLLCHDKNDQKHLGELKKVIELLGSANDHDRDLILESVADHLKKIPFQ